MLRLLFTRSGRRELAALRALETVARELDSLFTYELLGEHPIEQLDGQPLTDRAIESLLCMHDFINCIDAERTK